MYVQDLNITSATSYNTCTSTRRTQHALNWLLRDMHAYIVSVAILSKKYGCLNVKISGLLTVVDDDGRVSGIHLFLLRVLREHFLISVQRGGAHPPAE